MEATLGWYWAADVIGECGARLHLAHPLGIKAFAYQRVKKDESDARLLADLLRMGRLPESWIAPPEVRQLREAVRYRHKIVEARANAKAQVHGVLGKAGVKVPVSDLFGVAGNALLDSVALDPRAGQVTLAAWADEWLASDPAKRATTTAPRRVRPEGSLPPHAGTPATRNPHPSTCAGPSTLWPRRWRRPPSARISESCGPCSTPPWKRT